MKSKKLFGFLIVFVLLTVLIVLNSTLFTLQKINLSWLTTTSRLKNLKVSEVAYYIEEQGDSIFLLDKDSIASRLEKAYPYLEVVSIETKFPNKIVVHSAEREEVFAVSLVGGEYAILDGNGKVLRNTDNFVKSSEDLTEAEPIEVSFGGTLNGADFVKGEYVKISSIQKVLSQLSYTFKEANYSTVAQKGVFEKITFSDNGIGGLQIEMTTKGGVVIRIRNGEENLTDKFMLGLQVYNDYHEDSIVDGVIEI